MDKILFSIILLSIGFEAINCYVEQQNEIPEPKTMDIKIFGRKIKLNILEIKSDFRGKDDQLVDSLTDKIGLNRKKRADEGSGGGSDNSMMGSAQKVWTMAQKNIKSVADQAAKAAKSVVDTVKNTFTG